MENDAARKLRFGHTWKDVPNVRCAWGARWIFPDDQVHDRTDYVGSDEDWQELRRWLIDVVGRKPFEMACGLRYAMQSRADEPYVLFEDDNGKFVGHPHGPSGYLYVVTWLKGHEVHVETAEEAALWSTTPDIPRG